MFVGIQFQANEGSQLALVHTKWLTPRKKEVWWPPYKLQEQYNRALRKGDSPTENWRIFDVARSLFLEGRTHFFLEVQLENTNILVNLSPKKNRKGLI